MEVNENTRVARGMPSTITEVGSKLSSSPKFQAATSNIVADQNFSEVLNLFEATAANSFLMLQYVFGLKCLAVKTTPA